MRRQEEDVPCRVENRMAHDELLCEQLEYRSVGGVCSYLDIHFYATFDDGF